MLPRQARLRSQPWVTKTPAFSTDDWRGVADANATGGSYRVSNVAGPNSGSARFSFTGTAVTWITLTGPDQGKAQVLIDGVSQATFDNYNLTVTYNVQRTISNLTNAAHTITIRVAGSKNASSTGYNVVVNGFVVNGVTTNANTTAIVYNYWAGNRRRWPATELSVPMQR